MNTSTEKETGKRNEPTLFLEYSKDRKFWFSKAFEDCKYFRMSINSGKTWTAPMPLPRVNWFMRKYYWFKRLIK